VLTPTVRTGTTSLRTSRLLIGWVWTRCGRLKHGVWKLWHRSGTSPRSPTASVWVRGSCRSLHAPRQPQRSLRCRWLARYVLHPGTRRRAARPDSFGERQRLADRSTTSIFRSTRSSLCPTVLTNRSPAPDQGWRSPLVAWARQRPLLQRSVFTGGLRGRVCRGATAVGRG
jgi:hypothetical protein